MSYIKKILDFYLYSSLHIGLAAAALTYQSVILLDIDIPLPFYLFVFGATVFLYCLHRIIGIKRMPEFLEAGRFEIIKQYRSHIQIYAILGLIVSAVTFLMFPWKLICFLLLPSLFSLAYVLPIFKNKFRLRDFNFIKIFLIAFVWAYITVLAPAYYIDESPNYLQIGLIFLERFLFVFAITIPFDIRDIEVDKHTSVKTLVHTLGEKLSMRLSIILILGAVFINHNLMINDLISSEQYFGLLAFYALLSLIIIYVSKKKSDYYFSGLLDGTMILSPIIVYIVSM